MLDFMSECAPCELINLLCDKVLRTILSDSFGIRLYIQTQNFQKLKVMYLQ